MLFHLVDLNRRLSVIAGTETDLMSIEISKRPLCWQTCTKCGTPQSLTPIPPLNKSNISAQNGVGEI